MPAIPALWSGLVLAALLGPAALAQTAGQRLWALDVETTDVDGYALMSQPRVAPDGTVYLVTDSLYAIAPGGGVLWTAPAQASYVDVGPDGTVYAAAVNTVYAYNPDGTERWRFTESPAGQGITSGPTVGPDGNVYAVFSFGMGAVSLTPDGALRWSVGGFLSESGVEQGRIAFGPDNLYYADDWLPGCSSPTSGLISIALDGEVEWCRVISGVFGPPTGPQATLDGRAVVRQNALPGIQIQAYTPDGDLDWTQSFLPTNIGVGPDNNLYAFHDMSTLVSLTADGDVRWAVPQPVNNFPWMAVVSPDTSAVVSGSGYGFGENGTIVAADPADGRTLWSLPVTGPSAGAGGPAAFSPDGSVVYVPVNTLSFDEPDQLWAIQVRDARPSAAEPGEGGGALTLSAASPNPARSATAITLVLAETGRVTVDVLDALGRRVAVLTGGDLPAGRHVLSLDASALVPGVYVVRAVGVNGAHVTRRVVVTR